MQPNRHIAPKTISFDFGLRNCINFLSFRSKIVKKKENIMKIEDSHELSLLPTLNEN